MKKQEANTEPELTCPSCGAKIKLTESLAAPLVAATETKYRALLAKRDEEAEKRAVELEERETAVQEREQEFEEKVEAKVKEKQKALTAEAKKSAEISFKQRLESAEREKVDLEAIIEDKDKKLTEAQRVQKEALKLQRQLETDKKELDLNVEKQVNEKLAAAEKKAEKAAEEKLGLKLADKEQTIEGMKKTIEDLKRKAEQGSQQLQGEVLELKLEDLFKARFPHDVIEPVAKGERGADILHRVNDPLGNSCGVIIWESKRTKNWSPGWLPKLREDQRVAKADVAVVISQAMPDGVETFDLIDDVWVVSPRAVLPFALFLRRSLVELGLARQSKEGQHTKMDMVYQYLTGPRFKLRVQAIVEAFSTMQEDLLKERKATEKQWAKRDAQLGNAMVATVGMYGDLQGIAGKTLLEVDGLEFPSLEGPTSKEKV
ncbi:MAG: hypothetical protein BroJett014_03990 [Planctomycetota bacterium]|nr:DUF2130 domain-containing protein [Planctomycetota bacterium]GIK51426.1 MAG: hypothetical protein BroJett014_03990 [Planctomycetota bacterium]